MIRLRISLLLFWALLTNTVAASSPLILVTEELPPYQFFNQQGKPDGYAVEVMKQVISAINEKPGIQIVPWARAYKLAKNRANTVIFSISRSPLRESSFIWGGKLTREELIIWTLKDNKTVIQSINDLKPYSIAFTRSSNPALYFKQRGFNNIVLVSSAEQNLKMLLNGDVDYISGTTIDFNIRVKEMGVDIKRLRKVISVPELSHDLFFAFSLGTDKKYVSKLTNAFEKIKSSGELSNLKIKWQIEF